MVKTERKTDVSRIIGKRPIPDNAELTEIQGLVDEYDYKPTDSYSTILLLAINCYSVGKMRGIQEERKNH